LSLVILDFGGNGPKLPVGPPVPGYPNGTGGGCVQEGPFREGKFELHVAPKQETERKDRCLSRDINNQIAWDHATHEKVAKILEQPDFGWMTKTAEGLGDYPNLGIHNMAHYIISGTSGDTFDSNAGMW
jgi:tyrosinase